MTFNAAIERIMHNVQNGSNEPFIICREKKR